MSAASPTHERPQTLPLVLAFLAVYVIWGSTYLAIRVAVATVPPFFAAGARFLLAGLMLLVYCLARHMPVPTVRQWRNLTISAAILFVPSYGGLFWAEKSVPSGIASALVATIPLWMAVIEVFILKHSRLRWQLVVSVAAGITGVSILTLRGTGGVSHSIAPYLVLLMSQITWSIGTLLTKNMDLPSSKPLIAGAQMGLGGVMLSLISIGSGELSPFPHVSTQAAMAILYLTVFGSVVAFTAYLYLLHHLPATTVSSYAYVNPVVALGLGHWLGHEILDLRVFVGTFLVIIGVVLTLRGNRAH
jgi:drug/metabolite transporter (DMT)-like permease